MLLQLDNTDQINVGKLLDYARTLNLHLSVIDEADIHPSLPGKPLSTDVLKAMIESGRKAPTISMEAAHTFIRNNYNAH